MRNKTMEEIKRFLMAIVLALIFMIAINIVAIILYQLTEYFICQMIIFLFVVGLIDYQNKEDDENNFSNR